MIQNAWTLAMKDLRMYFRDRMGLVTSLLVPIALVTVFGWIMAYAFGGGSGMPKVKIWIVDEDQSPRSQLVEKTLRDSSMIECLPTAGERPITREKLQQMVTDGDAHHGLVIPRGFGATDQSTLPEIDILRDPGRLMEDRILQFALVQALFTASDSDLWKQSLQRWVKSEGASDKELQQFNRVYDSVENTLRTGIETLAADWPSNEPSESKPSESKPSEIKTDVDSGQPSQDAASSPETKMGLDDVLSVIDKALPVHNVDIEPPTRPKRVTYQQAQSISGITVMMMMFSLTNAGALLLMERERGTLKRLLALSMPRSSILLGKYFYVIVAGLIQMAILMVYGELMFRVGLFRDPVTLFVLIVTWVATAGSFGMAIATLSTSAKQGDGLATITILIMAALGGCWFPVQLMSLPLPLDIASKCTLTYWAMEGFQGLLWNGLSFMDAKILKAIGIQWLWALGLGFVSWMAFKRNYIA